MFFLSIFRLKFSEFLKSHTYFGIEGVYRKSHQICLSSLTLEFRTSYPTSCIRVLSDCNPLAQGGRMSICQTLVNAEMDVVMIWVTVYQYRIFLSVVNCLNYKVWLEAQENLQSLPNVETHLVMVWSNLWHSGADDRSLQSVYIDQNHAQCWQVPELQSLLQVWWEAQDERMSNL